MRKRVLALALVLLVLVSVLPPGLAAEATGKVVFESGPENADGVFEVTVTAYDMTVWGVQFAIRYDPEVVQVADPEGNEATMDTVHDVIIPHGDWTNAFATAFEPDAGLYGALAAAPFDPNQTVGGIVAGAEGEKIMSLRFKRLKDGDTGLALATETKGQPFQAELAEGMEVSNMDDGVINVSVVFQDADKPDSGKSEAVVPYTPPQPEKTADELLDEAVILKIGSHAAVVKGNVAAIYYGERDVTAYAHDNRTFVPVRFVGERLGATVGWINETQTVTVEKDGHKIEMPIGSSTYTLDGEAKTLDAPAELTPSTNGNSRTMVPIRFVTEALGYQVEWDQARNLVVIVPKSLGWDPKGETEAQAMDQAVTNLAMFSNFV